MKPEDALKLLDQAVSQMSGTREVHVQLQQAVECLKGVIAGLDAGDKTAEVNHDEQP